VELSGPLGGGLLGAAGSPFDDNEDGSMALKAGVWVHGTAVEIEGPVEEVTRRGTGALIRGRSDTSARVCFPIPTQTVSFTEAGADFETT
jgi:hypothetical protein